MKTLSIRRADCTRSIRSGFLVGCVAVMLALAVVSEARAGDCVTYDRKASYVDPTTKHLILRFNNKCTEARTLRVWYNGNYYSPVGGTVAGKGAVDIDVGVRGEGDPPFRYTDDGTDPAPNNR